MRDRGVFTHHCPQSLVDKARGAASKQGPPRQAGTQISPSKNAAPVVPALTSADEVQIIERDAPARTGFLVELEELEIQTALLREEYTLAFAEGDLETGKMKRNQYFELLEQLRKYTKDRESIALANKELVRFSDVEAEMGDVFVAVVQGLLMMGGVLHVESQSPLPRRDFIGLYKARLRDAVRSMKDSRYAPPLELIAS